MGATILSRKALRESLAALKACLPAKPLTELDGAILLSVAPSVVGVSATDMVQEAVYELQTLEIGSEAFDVVPDLKKLEKALQKAESDDVILSYDSGSGTLRVASKGLPGFVDVPTFSAAKKPRYDRPTSPVDPCGSLDARVLAASMSFIEDYLPETVTGQMKFEAAILRDGVVSGANGWNRRGYFVSRGLALKEELKILQRFVSTLPKVLSRVLGNKLEVRLYDRTIVMSCPGFSYSCVRAKHDMPDPVLSYLKSSDPYVTLDTGKLVKLLDRVTIPDYNAAGSPVGVRLQIPAHEEGAPLDTSLKVSLVAYSQLKAEGEVACKRDSDRQCSALDKVVDYRMFKSMSSALPTSADVRCYISNQDSRFFKFQGKYVVGDFPCVTVSVGSYSKVIGPNA